MSGPKEEIEDYINRELPVNFTSDEIMEMYENLEKDIALKKRIVGMTDAKLGMICQQNHRALAFAYPSIFFKTIKGEMRPEVLRSVLSLKKKLDTKELSLDEARMGVIDGAKEDIKNNPKESRPHVPKGDVQELTVKVKADGSVDSPQDEK